MVVLKKFAILTGKQLCWSPFLIKIQAFKPGTLLKRDPNTGDSSEYCEIFKNTYFEEHLRTAPSEIKNVFILISKFRKYDRNTQNCVCTLLQLRSSSGGIL